MPGRPVTDQPVLVFATFHPKPGQQDALLDVLRGMIAPTREEPGNELYDLYSSDDGRALHFFERYLDADALEAHRASEHYKAYRARLPDLLEQPVAVNVLTIVDAQGG